MCLNHDNGVCRSISLSKLLCKNSTFSSNYNYLSCKYELSNPAKLRDTGLRPSSNVNGVTGIKGINNNNNLYSLHEKK